MMQTRETRLLWRRRKRRFVMETLWHYSKLYTTLIIIGCLTLLPQGITAQYNSNDELYIVKPTPALRLGKEELTTVLLVKNENHGRYINVKPEVGLLTSTARTFIQEGVTTEYATQVIGTTLDNGRVYAQYLKKSSRVLYDSDVAAQPSVVTSWVGGETLKSDAVFLPQSHNDLFNADQPDWRAIDDSLESDRRKKNNEFIGNTDYIAVPYKQSYSVVNEKNADEIGKFVQTSPSLSYSINSKIAHNFLPQLGVLEEIARKVAANKVLPIGDLPTYTIKQNYEPNAAYVVSNDYNYELENDDNSVEAFGRNPKRIYSNLISSHLKTEQALETRNFNSSPKPIIAVSRNLATVTYYGFADFTTVVGDSVIVFSPSTSSAKINYNAHVTSIKGKATLGAGLPQEPSVSKVPITIAQDIIEPSIVEMSENSKTSLEIFSSTMINFNEVQQNTVTRFMDETILSQNSIDILEKTEDIIQQTQSQSSSSMSTPVILSRPSDEDILRIYNSLANAGNDKSVISANTSEASVTPFENVDESFTSVKETLETSNMQTLEDATTKLETSNVQTFGGATTIFFEEEPFNNFVEPVKTMNILESTSSLIRESFSEVSIDSNTIVMNSKSQNTDSKEPTYTQKPVENLKSIDEFTHDIVLPTSEINLVNNLNKFITTSEPQSEQYSQESMKPSSQDIMTTNNNILSNVLVKEIDPNKDEVPNDCISTSQVFLTQQPKTVTQFETVIFSEGSELKTEIKEEIIPTFEIKEATKYYCIQASKVQLNQLENTLEPTTMPVLNQIENTLEHVTVSEGGELEITIPKFEQKQEENDTTVLNLNEANYVEQIMVEEKNIEQKNEDDSKHSSAEIMDNDDEDQQEDEGEVPSDVTDDEDDDGEEEEIELIYKTLYTTYTYLTTFFHDDATSISSHTEIVTNVMTSTLDINTSKESTSTNPNYNEINPSTVSKTNFLIETTKRFEVPSEVESLIRTDDDDNEENETVLNNLDHFNKSSETLATFYTTYTYYTTIFAEGETEIMSHTEVITNIKKSSIMESEKIMPSLSLQQSDISLSSIALATTTTNAMEGIATIPNIPDLGDLSAITLITDVRSSSSSGDKQIISNKLESNNVQQHSIYEDQLSSESNTDVDEIIPSATLLLQTSFTTFTYYTTMYSGDKTNVISRLETMTNTVTETLQPSKTISLGDNTVPITYFTTFTYWTKLAKDGQITTLSREETISNVVLPTPIQTKIQTQYENPTIMQFEKVQEQSQRELETTEASENEENSLKFAKAEFENKLVTLQTNDQTIINDKSTENSQIKPNILEPTTYYTTYTYYTTSYENDKTSTVSRFETITNIVTPTVAITNNPITENTQEPAILESLTSSSSMNRQNNTEQISTLDLILYDFKKIIDADGVSTIFFTTEIKPTVNSDGLLTQVVSSSSSLFINEEKRSTQGTASLETVPASIESGNVKGNLPKQYKTGLVRLIEGTRIGNGTTTLYQSKVIGTVIDQRYAQIIESTSSFIFENKNSAAVALDHNIDIIPTLSSDITNIQRTQHESIYNINTANVQISITEQNTVSIPKQEVDVEQEEDNLAKTDERLRLPFQTKKSQYSTAVKPFPNRTRPQFAGKKNSSATIITRSDFTPTITATPALKTINRFSSTRRGGIGGSSIGNLLSFNTPSRRFGRPSKSAIGGLSSAGSSSSSSRNRFASSSNPRGSFGSSSRRLGASAAVRPSFSRPPLFSSGFPGNSRLRVRPTATLDFGGLSSSVDLTTSNLLNSQEDNTEDSVDDQEEQDEENTTTENSRRQNPLLRLRRPLNRPQGFTQARIQTNNPNNPVTIRRNSFINNSRSAATTTTTTTAKPKPRTLQPPLITQNRIRPTSSLFPPRNIFGLQKPKTNTEETKDLSEEDTNENTDDADYEDDDEEELEGDEDEETNRRRRSNYKRSKREADSSQQNRSNFRNRFRRPKLASASQQHEATSHEDEANETKETTKSSSSLTTTTPHRTRARFGNRYSGNTSSSTTSASSTESTTTNHKSIRPTRPSHSNGSRPQFTLHDKDSSSTSTTQKGLTANKRPAFRRPQPPGSGSASNRRISSSTASSNKRRLKSFTSNDATTTSRNTVNGRIRSSSSTVFGRGRPTTGTSRESNAGGRNRARNNHNYNNSNDPVVIENSGTITVTHVIPAEVTIPAVNGKVTEYKQVVTAKTSTEILGPQQYTTTIGMNGMTQLALTREDSSVNYNGATEVTQYILHETPTTTITFTPTTIRGRKTSFSHVLPSTVYSVEQVISTVQPQLSANAPLANILLSQLLLGNVGLPAAGNPLLGALGGALTQPGVGLATALGSTLQPATPVTEYRTHASTYVTTVYEGQSTVLPVTFQGKKILTTIYDYSAQTITATEFITDTIVTTPTVSIQPQPVVNSLLLQQLLLQQHLQQQQQQQLQQPTPDPSFPFNAILNSVPPQFLLGGDNLQELEVSNNIRGSGQGDLNEEDFAVGSAVDLDDISLQAQVQTHKTGRKKSRKSAKNHKRKQINADFQQTPESSVITLYVSGRRPGEFSTVLSTVQIRPDSTVYKRHAHTIDSDTDFLNEGSEIVPEIILLDDKASYELHIQSQHLDSGRNKAEVDKDLSTLRSSYNYRYSENTKQDQNDDVDEARYNLATRIMSNGVEVIIASDKSKTPDLASDIPNNQIQKYNKPVTLAANTIKNQMKILLYPSSSSTNNAIDYKSAELMQEQNLNLSFHTNYFITKTCFTTLTYRTTFVDEGQTTVESRERVISNIATEERSYPKITPSLTIGITLTRTPELAVGIFPTTYSYFNTYRDASNKLQIMTSDYTIKNTLTGPNEYIAYLQHTTKATPVLKTNTYYNEVNMTHIGKLHESNGMEMETIKKKLTQVVVTKSHRNPIHNTEVLTSYFTYDMDDMDNIFAKNPILIDKEEENEDKHYLNKLNVQIKTDILYDIQIYATKIFLKTLTYYTSTVLNTQSTISQTTNLSGKTPSTLFNYYTRIIENIVTNSIEPTLLPTELLTQMKIELRKQKQKNQYKSGVFVTTATLNNGQTLEISAAEMVKENASTIFPKSTMQTKPSTNVHYNEKVQYSLAENGSVIDEENNSITSSPSEKILTIVNVPNNSVVKQPSSNNILNDNNSNSTKTTTNQLMKHLTVIKPMLNAMADLLQNNFGLNRYTESIKNIKSIENKQTPNKKINSTINSKHPIYIPVQDLPNKSYLYEISNYSAAKPQNLFIKPPINVNEENIFDMSNNKKQEKQFSENPTYSSLAGLRQEHPLQNGGIFIRPGEVITTNSDVIVGKPNGIEYAQIQNKNSNTTHSFSKDNRQFQVTYYHNSIQHPYKKKSQSHRPEHIPVTDDKVLGLRPPMEQNFNTNILKPPPSPLPSPHSLHFSSITPNGLSVLLTAPSKPTRIRNNSQDPTIKNTKHFTAEIETSLELQPNIINFQGHVANGYNFQQAVKNNEELEPKLIVSPGNDVKNSQLCVHNFRQILKNNEILEIQNVPQIFSFDVKPSSSSSPLNIISISSHTPYVNMHTETNNYNNFDKKYEDSYIKLNLQQNNLITQTASPLQSQNIKISKISSIFSTKTNWNSPSAVNPEGVLYNRKIVPQPLENNVLNINTTKFKNFTKFSSSTVKLDHSISTQKLSSNFDSFANENGQYFNKHSYKIKPYVFSTTYRPIIDENLNSNIPTQKESLAKDVQNISFDHSTNPPVNYENIRLNPSIAFKKQSPKKSSQNISLNQHIFSHTVNVNVPPLTFNREDVYYPQQITANEQKTQVKPSYMPLITFPASKQHVQVKLTPLNTMGSLKSPANKLISDNNVMITKPKIIQYQKFLESSNIVNVTPKHATNFMHYGRQQQHLFNNISNTKNIFPLTLESPNKYQYFDKHYQQETTTTTPFKPLQSEAQVKAENRKILTNNPIQTSAIKNVLNFKNSQQNSSPPVSTFNYKSSHNIYNRPEFIVNNSKQNIIKSDIFLQDMKEFDDISKTNKIKQKTKSPTAADVNEIVNLNNSENIYTQPVELLTQKGIPFSNIPREKQIKMSNRTASISVALGEAFRIPTNKETSLHQRNRTLITIKPQLIVNKEMEYKLNFTTKNDNFEMVETKYNSGGYQISSNNVKENRTLAAIVKHRYNKPPETNLTKETDFGLESPVNNSTVRQTKPEKIVKATLNGNDYIPTLNPTKVAFDGEISENKITNTLNYNIENKLKNSNLLQVQTYIPTINTIKPISENKFQVRNHQTINSTKVLIPTIIAMNPTTNESEINYEYDKRHSNNSSYNKLLNNLLPSEIYKERQISNTSTLPLTTSILTLTTTTIKRIILPTKYITNNNAYNETTTETIQRLLTPSPSIIRSTTTTIFLSTTETTTTFKTLFLIHTQINTIIDTVTSIKTINPITITTTTLKHSDSLNKNTKVNTIPTIKRNTTQEINYLPYPTVEIVSTNITQDSLNHKSCDDNMFIIMTNNNKNKKNTILTQPSHKYQQHHTTQIDNTVSLDTFNNEMLLVYDNDITFDDNILNGSNDEDDEESSAKLNRGQPFSLSDNIADNKENAPDDHIILGGVLIATPPKSSKKENVLHALDNVVDCNPQCKSSRNEQCTLVDDNHSMCLCTPGFARIFPDRPCKPTYSYSLAMHVERIGNYPLQYINELKNNKTEYYKQLTQLVKNALDRMVMQSDFRDAYYGAEVTQFGENSKIHYGILVDVVLQLSDNSTEKRLEDVFKKNLRLSNYSIGGTDLYTNIGGVDALSITDFNECLSTKFHDCSENAHCFNLLGTYTCRCVEGYADLSNNPIYPGRICSSDQIGCEKCNYRGKCINFDDRNYCECFPWYAGSNCQVNLKILLIILLGIGSLLFILLLFCILITCTKRRNNLQRATLAPSTLPSSRDGLQKKSRIADNILITSVGLISSIGGDSFKMNQRQKSQQIDKHSMIKDSSSETSQNSLPYVVKNRETTSSPKNNKKTKCHSSLDGKKYRNCSAQRNVIEQCSITGQSNDKSLLEEKYKQPEQQKFLGNSIEFEGHYCEQSDRSLTVMIPRAKYHSSVLSQTQLMHHQLTMERIFKSTKPENN